MAIKIDVYPLNIPFRMEFAHAMARRSSCDSVVVAVSDGEDTGYGEAVIREYVTGKIGEDLSASRVVEAVETAAHRLTELRLDADVLRTWVSAPGVPRNHLPLVAGIETACWDLICRREKRSLYDIMGIRPLRDTIVYGGTVPILPINGTKQVLQAYKALRIANLRLKLGPDNRHNREVAELARAMMGPDFDLRADANATWSFAEAESAVEMLLDLGISTIEQPFAPRTPHMERLCSRFAGRGLRFVADESVLTIDDLKTIARDGLFSMVNLRLSKNGGIVRSLDMAQLASDLGLEYQIGCLVGETGILSAAGRFVASVVSEPAYVDGSYDSHLLSDNITRKDISFGPGGVAPVLKGAGIGYEVDTGKLRRLTQPVKGRI